MVEENEFVEADGYETVQVDEGVELTQEEIAENIRVWKETYGQVFVAQLEEFEFYFRLLTYQEYSTLNKLAENEEVLDEMICQLAILSPYVEDWTEEIFAGYVSTLGRTIREESLITSRADGSNDVKKIVNEGIEEVSSNFLRQMPLVIARAFPGYTLDEVKGMTLRRQVDLYVEAAWVIKQFEDIDLEFQDD